MFTIDVGFKGAPMVINYLEKTLPEISYCRRVKINLKDENFKDIHFIFYVKLLEVGIVSRVSEVWIVLFYHICLGHNMFLQVSEERF